MQLFLKSFIQDNECSFFSEVVIASFYIRVISSQISNRNFSSRFISLWINFLLGDKGGKKILTVRFSIFYSRKNVSQSLTLLFGK